MSKENYRQNTEIWPNPPRTKKEVIQRLKDSPFLYGEYRRLNQVWKQQFLDFCSGRKSLPLTYDPFFKRIFHPDVHPDRLSRLISSLLNMKVQVVAVLPTEDSILEGDTLLIMDLLGRLEDGSLVNVEIQKSPYAFPAERISCYSSDLMMRQYAQVKGQKGSDFTYRDIKKVYVIVIYERSSSIFHKIPTHYVHHGKTTFDTGLELELLQDFYLIALDVFRQFPYPKSRSEQTAWLSLLSTENLEDAQALIREYPWLEEIYAEIAMLRQKPEEVLGMYSEALRILDQNTVKYMIDEMKKELEDQSALIETLKTEKETALQEKDSALQEKDSALQEKDSVIQALLDEIHTLKNHEANRS